ncbi:MAG: hypothetical protein KatS3mg097_394 [Candidatus Parcubacteria bacterium]|nr:MAG: hypothetical protein KatS3mg097_394 [Candidatus Parcubacteria bacterium]
MPIINLPQPSELLLTQCSDIATCFQAIYNLLVAILIALSFLFFVFGAFQYILSAANIYNAQEGKDKMKKSLIALIIALIMPAIMYFVNADIFTNVKLFIPKVTVDLPPFDPNVPGTFPGAGGGDEGVEIPEDIINKYSFNPYNTRYKCDIPIGSSACDSDKIGIKIKEAIGNYNFKVADGLALICLYESGGESNMESKVDKCKDGNSFSIGLFQVNMAVHSFRTKDNTLCNPGDIFERDDPRNVYTCRVKNQELYSKCAAALKDPEINMNIAIELAKSRIGLNHWSVWKMGVKKCFIDPENFRLLSYFLKKF